MMTMKEMTISMNDFHGIYKNLSELKAGGQKKIAINSCLSVFFGYNFSGKLRLSFLSRIAPPVIESTVILNVVQGKENSDMYWTSFDLLNSDLKEAYFSFCENLVDSIVGCKDDVSALCILKRRFVTWKKLFQKINDKEVSKNRLMGVFGELVVLKDIIAPKYGIDTAVHSWGGPDLQSKDFTLVDTWYEVKTIGANSDSIHISSITQLSSDTSGHLIVVCAEVVSPEFGGKTSAPVEIIKEILLLISDESTETEFMQKIQGLGINFFCKGADIKFDIKSMQSYRVSDLFPRITEQNIPFSEITDVNYAISRAAIKRFEEE